MYRGKPPAIPYAILSRFQNELPIITSGFLNIILIWIDRGKPEPFPEDRLQRLSAIRGDHWKKYKSRVIEHLNDFYTDFIPYWLKSHGDNDIRREFALKGRKKIAANRVMRRAKVASLADIKQIDSVQEFSRQPHMIERIHTLRHGETEADLPVNNAINAPVTRRNNTPKPEFKPSLKDA